MNGQQAFGDIQTSPGTDIWRLTRSKNPPGDGRNRVIRLPEGTYKGPLGFRVYTHSLKISAPGTCNHQDMDISGRQSPQRAVWKCTRPFGASYTTADRRPRTDMSPSASKLKKKPKARLSRGGPGPDRSEAGAHSQRVEPANLPARLEDRGKADPPTGEYQGV